LAGPSRLGSIAIVTVLSCVVLGAVWSLVLYTLPQSDLAPEPTPAFLPRRNLRHLLLRHIPVFPPRRPRSRFRNRWWCGSRRRSYKLKPRSILRLSPCARRSGGSLKCDLEIEALCPEEEGERRACLQRKAAQLSAPCRPMLRERLVRMKEAMQQLRTACEADRRQFCREVPLGGGALVQCLESHAQEVSDQCFQLLPKRGRLLN
jgi:hypothetical protein